MFSFKELQNALLRMQSVGELPPFVCVLLDADDQFQMPPLNHIGDYNQDELPRVGYDMREYQFVEPEGDKKKDEKKARERNLKKVKKFREFMSKKFVKKFFKDMDLSKKFRTKKFENYYVADFRTVPVEQLLDVKSKEGNSADFKGELGLLVTMRRGPRK